MILLSTMVAQGQIKIGGNVYGGGNHAEVKGSTKVTVLKGDIGAVMDPNAERPLEDPKGKVFGGARMANVGGNAFVHIDGENATDYILINQVYGGNDIAGQIGTGTVPTELTEVGTTEKKNNVDNTFNSYVRISTKTLDPDNPASYYTDVEISAASTNPDAAAYGKRTTDIKPDPTAKKVYIGQLFAGGNGDFAYTDENGEPLKDGDEFIIKQGDVIIARSKTAFVLPELNKTYLEIKGGSIVYGYGGGNNATVKEQNIIHIDNPSAVVNHILVTKADGTAGVDAGVEADADTYASYVASVAAGNPAVPTGYEELLSTARFKEMGINTTFSFPSSGAYQVGRFFGGNNKAEMTIQPKWNLLAGKVRNLYSGGNRGAMTSPYGLLLEIKDYSSLIVDNLYGGCRMADVKPSVNGEYVPCTNNTNYTIPNELAARTIVLGGHVNNVYGGNDVTGKVYGGNAVGIHTTVYGDVYGGGNGAYPYTDSESMKEDDTYGDFYFGDTGSGTDALNAFRPNAEQVSIRLVGDANNKTVIKGSVFLGGNCASLATTKSHPLVELKIGSHVIADKVFLGNNGEKMVDPELLKLYKTQSDIDLKGDPSVFASYMEGVAMPLMPSIVFDNTDNDDPETYEDYTSMIGSFYGGGNRGSMTVPGKTTLKFDGKLIIFDKLVGGCNNANVEAGEYNAAYEGGLLGSDDERDSYTDGGKIKDRLQLDLNNVVIRPQRWNDTFEKITSGPLEVGKEYYTTDLHETKFIADGTEPAPTETNPYYKLKTIGTELVWNTAKWSLQEDDFVSTGTTDTADDKVRRLLGGNVYGGCYTSGHVNGNVVININQDLIKRDVVFAQTTLEDPYTISGARRSGVLREAQGDDVMAVAMTVFGAGCGEETEIWGSTTVNHNNGYAFQIFGGGEEGVVGKKNNDGGYVYNAAYSTTVNLKGNYAGYSEKDSGQPLAEAEYIYGGGNEGDVLGDSYVYLGNGRVYDAFGGASNADIYGGTEVHVGYNGGFPWIRENVYGGNDFGGIIRGDRNHYTVTTRPVFEEELKRSSTYVKYIQGRVDSIFGGNYGYYNYADRIFKDYTDAEGTPLKDEGGNPIFSFPHLNNNSFVHFIPVDNSSNKVNYIFGGSAGFPGNVNLNDAMQKEAYVLIDDTQTKDVNRFANVDVYGGGAFAGVGLSASVGAGRTAVDLFSGSFHNVYGGCNREGLVGYARVNVPSGSTVKVNALFGGGKGYDPDLFVGTNAVLAERYCDHYVTCVDYQGKDAIVNDAIYGGNENCRISCDTYINIGVPVMQSSGYQATVYGAGYGRKTVSGRTNVFMNNGSNAYKVFGGGRDGNAFNFASLKVWLANQFSTAGSSTVAADVTAYGDILRNFSEYISGREADPDHDIEELPSHPINLPSDIGTYVNASGVYDGTYTNDILTGDYHQTNVHIMNGGNVSGYAYGGGFGTDAVVAGTTFIELKGGNVDRDIYGGGQGGPVFDEFELAKDEDATNDFVATTNVVIEGGMARNVYGGGYLGHVGKHCKTVDGKIVEAAINESNAGDIPAVANVTIGKVDGTGFYDGVPAIQRNVYGGGEGGSVYGTANLTINNGYIGYRYKNTATSGASNYQYVEELDDQKPNAIELAGNAFGGGYVVNSYVDNANVKMYGGTLRGSLYGGGEVGPIGRGTMKDGTTGGIENGKARIYKAGKTHVELYDGHVMRNVFGGGRGKDSWGGDGTKYMDEALIPTLDLKCKGYVFGQTEVYVYGGEVGTDEGVAQGYGNVFGGSDIGCVYSAYELADGTLCIGKKPTGSVRYDNGDEGYYYKYESGKFALSGGEKILTEDCKVVVEPWCKATSTVTINSVSYTAGDYVPTSALNYLGNKNDDTWASLGKTDVNKEGVIIHNAVFAGGNTSPGSIEVYANTTTVFGNATASIHDVYNRDLISIGRGRVGGLYGDGNLTLVDGYRELNITNYGTDYYHIDPEITLAEYNDLSYREQAYYEIRYKCLNECSDKNGKNYAVGSTITADEMATVFDGVTVDGQSMIQSNGKPLETYWKENGVCSRYAGRPMNTIQRADFCGVFGSRMVMQGAQDRVPEVVDYTNYTINRVREVSLNKKVSVRTVDAGDSRNKEHGNYFGIYSVVNYLGALTSDVDFGDENVRTDKRTSDNSDTDTYQATANGQPYGDASFYDWKKQFHDDRRRNNGNSHNKLALASGVYLELTSEKSTGKGLNEKDWGYITGVVELDLINVQPGMGGGYVYAKNEHGVRSDSGKDQTILTALNKNTATGERAVTNKKFTYTNTSGNQKEWETSGNFVHSTQTIIDDCYNIGGKYKVGENPVPAHYWFIRGAVYIYDQYISAYTGSPNAFNETVSIPLTITSASHGKMTLLNVQPNYYAYYSVNNSSTKTKLGENDKIELRDKEYGLNDAITYWDYSQLTEAEKGLFVDETYTVIADCTYGDGATPVTYKAGTVLLPSEYESLKASAPKKKLEKDDLEETSYVHHVSRDMDVDFDYVFRPSNNVSHDTGYILTYTIDNPNQWNTWYTPKTGSSLTGKMDSEKIKTLSKTDYEDAPTYTPKTNGLYGQNDYKVGNIISKSEYDTYQDVKTNHSSDIPSTGQAKFYPAYIVTADLLETTNKSGTEQRLHKGATLSEENYDAATWSTMYNPEDIAHSSVAPAYVVTSTVQLSKTEFIYRNTYLTAAEISDLKRDYPSQETEIDNSVKPAYYCTEAGKYGGNYYKSGNNYRALAAFSAMSSTDRQKFTYNYDALDLLIDPNYSKDPSTGNVIYREGKKYQYDSAAGTETDAKANQATYSLATSIDYSATYKGSESFTYIDDNDAEQTIKTDGTSVLTRTEYERLPNEQYYWAPISVGNTDDTYYVVTETIILGDTPYAAGQVITKDTYDGLGGTDKEKVASLKFSSTGTYYYCREAYTIPNNADGHAVSSATGVTGAKGGNYAKGDKVPTGVVITGGTDGTDGTYSTLTNKQKNFSIHGLAPTETSALYVTGGSDIFDLSAEKIITVIYQYDYVESDMAGTHITPVSERHVLNIHLNFKSGIPTVEDIHQPDIVLPGTMISIPEPYVTPGAYEISGGGWKLFDTESDAESHINGVEFSPTEDPLYLYQNKYYLTYYAKTYLGETYSNHVPVSVANYHDLKKVMGDKDHHYYIDHRNVHDVLKVEPKIYINDYSKDAEGSKNGLDLFKDLYDLSLLSNASAGVVAGKVTTEGSLKGHALLERTRVGAGKNLEFFMRTDIDHSSSSWTSVAGDGEDCFAGTLHGDGHHLKGLTESLFDHLCGDVYNLGVSGTFTGAGVAETGDGYVENCWVKTTETPVTGAGHYAVFGNPTRPAYRAVANGTKLAAGETYYTSSTGGGEFVATGEEESNGSNYFIKNSIVQVVNCYYPESNSYTEPTNEAINHGVPTPKPDKAFYNGEVAYDLNGFYLYKRYNDGVDTKTGVDYKYFTLDASGNIINPETPLTGYYADNMSSALCSSGYNGIKYVEDRFADGDFRYDGGNQGVIPGPDTVDERHWVETVTSENTTSNEDRWSPIWPDDYIFFGQKLNYGYDANAAHQEVPTAVVRDGGRLSQKSDANRVYRAPAYFRSKVMGVAHFNPHAYLAQKEKLTDEQIAANEKAVEESRLGDVVTPREVYPDMTAIDFKGHIDLDYQLGMNEGKFYTPLLDDDGLLSIVNADETKNLLVYAPASDVNAKTYNVLNDYFQEPVYNTHYDNSKGYRLVNEASAGSVQGHLVQSDKKATNDHLLVDKEDFNAPIGYSFDSSHLMWYQRKPENYVDLTKGWEGISLPFDAELVTTNVKGELTHFYKGSTTGHEYWLREYKGKSQDQPADASVYKADFNPMAAGSNTKDYTNTFLWDYYYSKDSYLDKNEDEYQKKYYRSDYLSKLYPVDNYPYSQGGTPYIIGFPGETYYEFDLSGGWKPANRVNNQTIESPGKQTVTFASEKGGIIGVSDDEMGGESANSAYTFKPSYMNYSGNLELAADQYVYLLDAEGASFKKTAAAAVTVTAFRPYFIGPETPPSSSRSVEQIVFGQSEDPDVVGEEHGDPTAEELNGGLRIWAKKDKIYVESSLSFTEDMRVVTPAGITVATFSVKPGKTVEVQADFSGMYIVHTLDGKYTKKVTVKK